MVDGDSGIMVRFAGCCTPVLGEDIVGYVSRGRGVTVHKCDCSNVKYLEQERLIKAEWADKTAKYKVANIHVMAFAKDDFLAKLTFITATTHFNLVGLDTKNVADKIICNLKIKLSEKDNINKLINEIKKLEDVLEVK